jgi:hypothetical protein
LARAGRTQPFARCGLGRIRSALHGTSNLILKPDRFAYPAMCSARDDYAVLHDGKIVVRIVQVALSGNEQRWDWCFRRRRQGYEMGQTTSREEAMVAFRRAWGAAARRALP